MVFICRLHEERGRLVEAGQATPTNAGCRGICPIPGALPYVSLSRLCVLPVMHIMTLGLAAAFWSTILRPVKRGELRPSFVLSNANKAILQRRWEAIQLTADFGRPYIRPLPPLAWNE